MRTRKAIKNGGISDIIGPFSLTIEKNWFIDQMIDKKIRAITAKASTVATGLRYKSMDSFHGFARTYATSYSICYMASAFMGLYIENLGLYPSAFLLFGVGVGTLFAIYSKNMYLLGFFAVGEAIGCVAHYLSLVQWVPTFSNMAFIVMAVLDLIQSMSLFRLMDLDS